MRNGDTLENKFEIGDKVRKVGGDQFSNRGAPLEVRAVFNSHIEGRSIFYALESITGLFSVHSETMLRPADSEPKPMPRGYAKHMGVEETVGW